MSHALSGPLPCLIMPRGCMGMAWACAWVLPNAFKKAVVVQVHVKVHARCMCLNPCSGNAASIPPSVFENLGGRDEHLWAWLLLLLSPPSPLAFSYRLLASKSVYSDMGVSPAPYKVCCWMHTWRRACPQKSFVLLQKKIPFSVFLRKGCRRITNLVHVASWRRMETFVQRSI